MGMFATIYFKCPNCGHEVDEAQSKSGSSWGCYKNTEVPKDIAIGANTHAPFKCSNCGKKWQFDIPEETVSLEVYEV